FLDPVAITAVSRLAPKCWTGMERDMDRGVRKVEEERVVLVGGNELDRLLGVAGGERVLFGRRFDDLFIAHQGQGGTRRGFTLGLWLLPLLFGRAGWACPLLWL